MTLPEAIADGLQALIEGGSPDDLPDPMLAVAVVFLRGLQEDPPLLERPLRPGVRSAIGEQVEAVRRERVPLAVNREAMLATVDGCTVTTPLGMDIREEIRRRLQKLPTINLDVAREPPA